MEPGATSSSWAPTSFGTAPAGPRPAIPSDFIANLTNEQLFDALAIQIDGPRAGDRRITLHWRFTDTGNEHSLTLQHGVLTHRRGAPAGPIDATVSVPRSALNDVIAGAATVDALVASGRLPLEGDQAKLGELLGLLDPPDPNFAIVTPGTGMQLRSETAKINFSSLGAGLEQHPVVPGHNGRPCSKLHASTTKDVSGPVRPTFPAEEVDSSSATSSGPTVNMMTR